jgi:hypothetical protein
MRQAPISQGVATLTLLLSTLTLLGAMQPPTFGALSDSQIQRLKDDLERTRVLVANGTLARIRLKQAEEALADAEDEGVLAHTLYSATPVEKYTDSETDAMLQAAQRRVDRQRATVEEKRRLLDSGAMAQADFEALTAALETREQVLVLAKNRVQLRNDLQQMAETERKAATAAALPSLQNSMTRYEGNGAFTLADMPAIQNQFERQFHKELPISALGQTTVHQALGLDHRNRVDVAINPTSTEGIWLRKLLERLRVPYLAFTSAVAGAATAPHIHIGVGSTRIRLAGTR